MSSAIPCSSSSASSPQDAFGQNRWTRTRAKPQASAPQTKDLGERFVELPIARPSSSSGLASVVLPTSSSSEGPDIFVISDDNARDDVYESGNWENPCLDSDADSVNTDNTVQVDDQFIAEHKIQHGVPTSSLRRRPGNSSCSPSPSASTTRKRPAEPSRPPSGAIRRKPSDSPDPAKQSPMTVADVERLLQSKLGEQELKLKSEFQAQRAEDRQHFDDVVKARTEELRSQRSKDREVFDSAVLSLKSGYLEEVKEQENRVMHFEAEENLARRANDLVTSELRSRTETLARGAQVKTDRLITELRELQNEVVSGRCSNDEAKVHAVNSTTTLLLTSRPRSRSHTRALRASLSPMIKVAHNARSRVRGLLS